MLKQMTAWEKFNTAHLVSSAGEKTGIAYFCPLSAPSSSVEARSARPTIIFLHGAESNHLEFSHVVPFLQDDYNIIAVDLPGHSGSKAIPFTFDNAINGLLHIINTRAREQKVHLVGLSLGGFTALEFARRHPEVVESVWCTGCTPFSGLGRLMRSQSTLLSGFIFLVGHVATEKMFWASFGADVQPIPEFRRQVQGNQNIPTLRPVFDQLMTVTWDSFAEIPGLKIAIVAGGKRDSVEDAARAGRTFRSKNARSRAFVVRDAIHWWSLQFPELFARGIRAWIEESEVPIEYESLLTNSE